MTEEHKAALTPDELEQSIDHLREFNSLIYDVHMSMRWLKQMQKALLQAEVVHAEYCARLAEWKEDHG